MKRILAMLLVGIASGPALAIECPVSHAIFEQPGRQVVLHFKPVPRDSAANQIAAFDVRIEDVVARFDGGIYLPNGFGRALGDVGQDCTGADGEDCSFWNAAVYALGADGITEFPYDPDLPLEQQMAPQQVLLPGFAANVWYSMLRENAFADERTVLDVFTLAACAK